METDHENALMLETTELTKDAIRKISETHKKMFGVNHVKFTKMYSYFSKHLRDFYEELISSCQMKLEELEKDAEKKYEELMILQEELSVTTDLSFDDSEPLNTIIEKLDEALRGFRSVKEERMEKLKSLLEKENELTKTLGVPTFPSICGVPTEEQIRCLDQHVNKLLEEKLNRRNTYQVIKGSILKLMKELEYATLSHYNEIHSSSEESYNLKLDYIENMKKLEDDLKKDLDLAYKNVEHLKEKLNKLWERIKIEQDYKSSFMERITGVGKSFQDMLKKELERCEEIKKANIKPVIESVRYEIREMWEKLTYTDEQRKRFISYYSETFSDDVLTLHEVELHKLQTIFEENKHIYELAEKRESLWKRMQHLDEVALDKNRFKNRGGQLLKEEKERKLLENSVPRTDSQLKALLIQYQERTGNIFEWHGKDLLKKIAHDWENRQNGKDSKKGHKKMDEHHKMTPDCRQIKNEDLQRQGVKRKMDVPSENIQQKAMKKTPMKSQNHYPALKINNKDGITPANDLSTDSIASYSVFQEQIEGVGNNENINNANKRGILQEINSPIRAHSSPTSTPIKCKTPKTPRTPGGGAARRCLITPKNWR